LPVIAIFGRKDIELVTRALEDYEEKRLDCRCYSSDSHLERVLIRDKPNVIITIGNRSSYTNMIKAPFEIQKRWLHYDTMPDLDRLGMSAYNHYFKNLFDGGKADVTPLITVFTAAYRTGEKIRHPFASLKEQTYTNWEWIIVDDSDDHGRTFKMLSSIAEQDHRVRVFKPWEHSGIIGEVKNWACSLAKGDILLERTTTMN